MPISLSGSLAISGSITTTSTITAQTLVVQTITSSISVITGSTNFGSLSSNNHTFTGSMFVTGTLNITGSSRFADALTIGSGNALKLNRGANDYYWSINSDSSNYLNFGTYLSNGTAYGTNPKLILLDNGNVGIGTTSPSEKLEVSGSIRLSDSNADGPQLKLASSGYSDWNIDNYSGNFRAYYGSSEYFRINAAGNVGIGTSSPSSLLHLNASTVTLRLSGGGYGASYNTTLSSVTGAVGVLQLGNNADNYIIGGNTAAGGYLIFKVNATAETYTSGTEAMRITSGGQVIIGSTTSLYPSVKLSVKQTSANIPAEIWSNYSGDLGNAAVMLIKYDNSSSSSQVFQRFVIDNGNTACGQINGNGASQVAFGSWSDSRLKDNIENLPSQLSNIMELRPVEFDYKNGSGHQIGFIAQEMKEVYPDAVGEDSDGFLTITGWSKTEARLVKAIQELKAQNDDLQSQINELKAQ